MRSLFIQCKHCLFSIICVYYTPPPHPDTWYGTYPRPTPHMGFNPPWVTDMGPTLSNLLLLASGGNHWRPFQTCSLEDLPHQYWTEGCMLASMAWMKAWNGNTMKGHEGMEEMHNTNTMEGVGCRIVIPESGMRGAQNRNATEGVEGCRGGTAWNRNGMEGA